MMIRLHQMGKVYYYEMIEVYNKMKAITKWVIALNFARQKNMIIYPNLLIC